MRKSKYCLLGAFCACLTLGVLVGCGDNDDDKKTSENPKEVMLADFEKWAPDFQTLRLRNGFGSVDVNTDSAYVKSGKQSAALTVVGADGAEKPLFFVNTVSGRFDYDYSDFSKIDSVSAWLYNASKTDETVYVGLITSIVSIEQVGYEKYETFTLKSGWNEVVYKPDMNYVISAVGQEEYDGIKGVYFMFDNPHAATKAEGKKFYVDDVKLNYGEEKPYSEVRAGKYYTSGTQIGAPNYITLKNPVTMKELEDKALSFEFKFDTDTGKFGFAIMCDDYNWNNITGTLVIEKTADGVFANMGRIETLEDGWYVWKLNKDMFAGDGAGRAESVSLIYHQGEVVQGNVIINWNSMKAADAYAVSREERAEQFTDGGRMFHYFYEKGIPMTELSGKALQFEFKFVSDTGKFGFTFMDDKRGWANITGELVIEKTADGEIIANMGKIAETEDGWYAWKLNSDMFAGDGANRAEIADLAFTNNDSVVGTVYLDWGSLKTVDAYTVTREEKASHYVTDDEINGNFSGQPALFDPIAMSALENKALYFEFKFASETGSFYYALQSNDSPWWLNVTGRVVIEKHADGTVTSNAGKIFDLENGWYAWELNSNMFAGEGASNASNVAIVTESKVTAGEVYIDWKSFKTVDAYELTREERASKYENGEKVSSDGGLTVKTISMSALRDKALHFEFKFTGDSGKFGFAIMDSAWHNITGTLVIEKKADGTVTANMGRIVNVADGWIAWELNQSDFGGNQALLASAVGMVYHQNETVEGGVLIDWDSVKAVESYASEAVTYAAGDKTERYLNYGGVAFSRENGKALHFEFKFTGATGKFGFTFMDNHHTPTEDNPNLTDWYNLTGALVIAKTADGITASIGKITEAAGKAGWYAWELNCDLFAGNGAAKADMVNLATDSISVEGGVAIDWHSLTMVNAYELTREERASQYADGAEVYRNFESGISMTELEGKALRFEFKFTGDSGKFGFAFMDGTGEWKNITGKVVIEKTANGVVSNLGKIEELDDGWYVWELNKVDFGGYDALSADVVNLIDPQGERVVGGVLIDWDSFAAVSAYAGSGTVEYAAGQHDGKYLPFRAIALSELTNKALQFEFRFIGDSGEFGFAFMDKGTDWYNLTNTLIITKTAAGVSANMGLISAVAGKDGWYCWKLNFEEFAGDGLSNAQKIDLIQNWIDVKGGVIIDWDSLQAAEEYSYFASNSKVSWGFANGEADVSAVEEGTHNALQITNSPTSEWTQIVLTIDPAMAAQIGDHTSKLSLRLKLERNTAAENLTFNFRIYTWKDDGDHFGVPATMFDGAVDGYYNDVPLDTWHTIDFLRKTGWGADALTPLIENGGKIIIWAEVKGGSAGDDFGYKLLIDDISLTSYKYVLNFETESEAELTARSYDVGRVSTVEISNEQANSGTKSIKVFQNQHGALIIKIPDEMKALITDDSKLTVRFMLADVKAGNGASVENPNPQTFSFYACSTPNSDTDQNGDTWKDCQISGNDWLANCEKGAWYEKTLSTELLTKVNEHGYLWIEVEMKEWQEYEFYVDYITLE